MPTFNSPAVLLADDRPENLLALEGILGPRQVLERSARTSVGGVAIRENGGRTMKQRTAVVNRALAFNKFVTPLSEPCHNQ